MVEDILVNEVVQKLMEGFVWKKVLLVLETWRDVTAAFTILLFLNGILILAAPKKESYLRTIYTVYYFILRCYIY